MKNRIQLIRQYSPVLGLLLLMILLLFSTTLPSLKANLQLNRIRSNQVKQIDTMKNEEKRFRHLMEALEEDPITIENYLRHQFEGARRDGESEVNGLTR